MQNDHEHHLSTHERAELEALRAVTADTIRDLDSEITAPVILGTDLELRAVLTRARQRLAEVRRGALPVPAA